MSPQRGHTRSLQVQFQRVEVHQVRALLEFPQLVDPQVVETTRFNPEGVLPHLSESRSTHFIDYLGKVSHVPQRLLFLLELPIPHVV